MTLLKSERDMAMKTFLLGFCVGLTGMCGYLLNRISVVSHRVDMTIMVQQSHDARLDALEKK